MAIAEIRVNGVVGSNDAITLDATVELSNSTSASTYLWTIVSQPSGVPAAVLSSTTASIVTFTANKEGSYLIRLVVDAGLPEESIDQVIVAVRELQTGNRIPAAGETTENDAETGWANTAVDQILQRVTRFTDSGVIVGVAAEPMSALQVVYVSDVATIATGLPGEREVPQVALASALYSAQVHGLVGVVQSAVSGGGSVGVGQLVRVAIQATVKSVNLGSPGHTAGEPVYVGDGSQLSLTPGTVTRQIGTIIDDMGSGLYGVWVTGTGTFGTVQSISATYPLVVSAGGSTAPSIALGYDTDLTVTPDGLALSTTGVTAGTYGDAATEPESLLPQFTVDAKGRLTAASQAPIQIGGIAAKVYVDAGDASTLAAAEAYTDARTFGLSSKVPVHCATTIPLPACTVNGTFQTLTADVHGPLLPANTDGHDLLVGERLLVKNQVASANNGIYVLTQKGASSGPSSPWILTRADDANTAAELCGSLVTVNVGDTLAGTAWLFAFNPTAFTLGTTPVVWTQLNAVPATTAVLGTVKLAGGLGGVGTTAALPVLAVGGGYVSGVLPVGNGGTGLSSAPGTDAFLVSNGAGAWTTRTSFVADSIISGTIAQPIALIGREVTSSRSQIPVLRAAGHVDGSTLQVQPVSGSNFELVIEAGGAATGGSLTIAAESVTSPTSTLIGGNLVLRGGNTGQSSGGEVLIQAGDGRLAGRPVTVKGGTALGGSDGGSVTVQGGDAFIEGTCGSVYVRGGVGTFPGDVIVEGGSTESRLGGNVRIQPGAGLPDGSVYIGRRSGSATGQIAIEHARINNPGAVGTVLTSTGTGANDLPTWQKVGGDAGPASYGAIRRVQASTTITTADFCIYAERATVGVDYTVTLPAAASIDAGRMFIVKSLNSGFFVSVAPNGTERIDDSATPIELSYKDVVRLMRSTDAVGVANGTEWLVI